MASSISFFPTPAERYTVLLDLARTLSGSFVQAELCRGIHAHVARVLPATSFTVALVDAAGRLTPQLHVGGGPTELPLRPGDREHLLAGDFVVRTAGNAVELMTGLLAEGRLVGCLLARRGVEQPFDAGDAHFLLGVGAVAGVALENARLFQELSGGRQEAELLETVARELGRSLELEDVAGRIVARVADLLSAPVFLCIVRGDLARVVAASAGAAGAAAQPGAEWHLPPGAASRLAARVGGGHGGLVLAAPAEGVGEPDSLLVPLASGDRLVALLTVQREQLPEEDARLRVLARLALHALSALDNALLHEEVRMLSLTDPLVQLPNRRQLDFFLEKEFAAAQRGRPLCFVLFDLDHFKDYNDAHGHQAGDQALIRFADVMRRETRAMNLAARYGGEEFAAVLSETSRSGAHIYAQRVRRQMAADREGELTVSAGVAVYEEYMNDPAELVAAADRALYRAKEGGRNRVCIADAY